jgi:hypothetical protein
MTLESEIYSIETANINKETLDAMKNASAAMKQIHGGLTIDKVDQTMYVHTSPSLILRISRVLIDMMQGGSPRTARHRRGNRRGDYAIYRKPRPGRVGVGR